MAWAMMLHPSAGIRVTPVRSGGVDAVLVSSGGSAVTLVPSDGIVVTFSNPQALPEPYRSTILGDSAPAGTQSHHPLSATNSNDWSGSDYAYDIVGSVLTGCWPIILLAIAVVLFGLYSWWPHSSTQNVSGNSAFEAGQSYSYGDYVLTQANPKPGYGPGNTFTVLLKTLQFNSSAQGTTLEAQVNNDDPTYTADFALYSAVNIYLVDNLGNRYAALSASPNEVVAQPGDHVAVEVTFPTIQSGVTYMKLYFNTDHEALESRCTELLPTGATSAC